MTDTKKKNIQELVGTVVSDRMMRTVVVEVSRMVAHPKYRKFIRRSKRYKAHDPKGAYHTGDRVVIAPCRPISKDKRWVVKTKVRVDQ